MGIWNARVLPLAVGACSTTFAPAIAFVIASA